MPGRPADADRIRLWRRARGCSLAPSVPAPASLALTAPSIDIAYSIRQNEKFYNYFQHQKSNSISEFFQEVCGCASR